jgi:hypothetical protein
MLDCGEGTRVDGHVRDVAPLSDALIDHFGGGYGFEFAGVRQLSLAGRADSLARHYGRHAATPAS